jgi:hypothetical protein
MLLLLLLLLSAALRTPGKNLCPSFLRSVGDIPSQPPLGVFFGRSHDGIPVLLLSNADFRFLQVRHVHAVRRLVPGRRCFGMILMDACTAYIVIVLKPATDVTTILVLLWAPTQLL